LLQNHPPKIPFFCSLLPFADLAILTPSCCSIAPLDHGPGSVRDEPGQWGTKTLAAKYGDNLLFACFRHEESVGPFASRQTTWLRGHRQKREEEAGKKLWFVKHGRIAGTSLEKHTRADVAGLK
jgi:hypothetical protein